MARHMDDAHKKNQFKYLLVVSAPAFLGVLRSQFSDQVNKSVCFELNKNLTMHTVNDIQKHLPKSLSVV
jgi:protein required for attachment to host cells